MGCRLLTLTATTPGAFMCTTRALRWECAIIPITNWLYPVPLFVYSGPDVCLFFLILGNSHMVQRPTCCSLCIPKDSLPDRNRCWCKRLKCWFSNMNSSYVNIFTSTEKCLSWVIRNLYVLWSWYKWNVNSHWQLIPNITPNYLKEGYMEKTGPSVSSCAPNDITIYMCLC